MKTYFGTDGVRGIPEKDLSKELVHKICKAVEDQLSPSAVAVIGDTRSTRRMIFQWIAEGFSSKTAVVDYGVLPSGSMAYILNEKNHDLGFIISASHNPSEYNGIKIIDKSGSKLSDESEALLEERINNVELDLSQEANVESSSEGLDLYLQNLLSCAEGIDSTKFNLSIDCANGAVTESAKKLLDTLSINYEIFNTDSDGLNINKDCGATNPLSLKESMTDGYIGLTFDGDADRLIMVDEEGSIANGDVMIALLAKYLNQIEKLNGGAVVTTVMANVGLQRSLDAMNITSVVTPVGDKYVAEAMEEHKASLGGEQSGHIILSDYLPVGDGLLTGIFMLKAISFFGLKLSELRKELITEYPQKLINFHLNETLEASKLDMLIQEMKEIEEANISEGRIFVRASGTEPLLRVLIEASTNEEIEQVLHLIEETTTKYLNIK